MDFFKNQTRPRSDEPVHPTNAIFPKDIDIKEEWKQLQESNNEVIEPIKHDKPNGMG